jgi:hypothetical protein
VVKIFELYASGQFSLSQLRKAVQIATGKTISRAYLHTILTSRFYVGQFLWGGQTYRGNHPVFISLDLYESVQAVLHGHNKPKYRKHEFAFRGLLRCAHDGCTITAERKKGKYVYYRCTGYRGKCATPRFTESQMAEKLGVVLKNIHIPDEILLSLQQSLSCDQNRLESEVGMQRQALEQRLSSVRRRMDQSYQDKLDGKISDEFWERNMKEWSEAELQGLAALSRLQAPRRDRVLDAHRILELANKAYSLYVTRTPTEQAELLRLVLLNCAVDGGSLQPSYRKPFDLICQRVKTEQWSGREDLNLRPPGPEDWPHEKSTTYTGCHRE